MTTTPTPHNERVEEILGRLRGASWYMSKEGKKGYFIDDETLTAHITSAITTLTAECEAREREICRKIFIEGVDWSEWGITREEAGEDFDAERKALTPPTV